MSPELKTSFEMWQQAAQDPLAAASQLGTMTWESANPINVHLMLTMRLILEVERLREELKKIAGE